jgi:glutathione S-transferase
MLTLFKGPAGWGLGDVSPFVLKVMVWLDLKGEPYRTELGDPRKAPKGKVPWIRDADGTVISDSSDILEHLRATRGALDGDAVMPCHVGVGHLVRRTLEESYAFALSWARWDPDENVPAMQEVFRPILPPVISGVVLRRVIRPGARRAGWAQGLFRHTAAQVTARAAEDLRAVSDALGDRPYFCGDAPGAVDCTAWSFIAQTFAQRLAVDPIRAFALNDPRLIAYHDRMLPRLPTAAPGVRPISPAA